MTRFKSKLLGLLLCFTMLLGMVQVQVQAGTADIAYVTREQAVVSILDTIGLGALYEIQADLSVFTDAETVNTDYTDALGIAVANGILVGTTKKTINPKGNVTRLEFAMFISRALRDLPVIKAGQSFSDIPKMAAGDVSRIYRAGLMSGYGNIRFGSDDYLTQEQLDAVLYRIRNLSATRVQDDFFYGVNQKWLSATKLPAGYPMLGSFDEVNITNNDRLKLIAKDLLKNSSTYQEGTKEQKIADFYATVLDAENRNREGTKPIQGYLDQLEAVKTVQELLGLLARFENETGVNPLFSFSPSVDLKDSTRYSLYGSGLATILPSVYMLNENAQIKALYEGFIVQMLMLAGSTQEKAMSDAELIYGFETVLAQNTLSNELASKIENIYNPQSVDDLVKMFADVDIKKYLGDLGYASVANLVVTDVGLMRKTGELVSDDHLETLKAYSRYRLIVSTAAALSKDFTDALNAFNSTFLGTNTTMSSEDTAFNLLNQVMSGYLGRMYVEKYFSEAAKKDVEMIVREIISTYQKRIEKLDWMSDSTKVAAISKLQAINIKIGYPDKWNDPLQGIAMKTYDEGGSLLGNLFAITSEQVKYSKTLLYKPVDKSGWGMPPQMVNAYYSATNNEIVFPAGILQAPFYDIKASREKNLGGIGTIIAHEITHAFDNNGAQFDAFGNMANWWTREDYVSFQQKCQSVIDLYQGLESAPNAFVNGNLTVSENVADIGAMACILEIVRSMPNANYKELFESNACIWRFTATAQMYAYLATQDVHAPHKFRVNQVLSNFQEFYDAYGINSGDAMYLAPEERVTVW